MAKQSIASLVIGVALLGGGMMNFATAGDCMFGCWDRPTCGKVCKLVCKEKTLTAVGYGCKCNTIAVPCPSCEGCKHCCCQCCPPDACGPCGTDKGDVCCGPCCPCCEAAPAKITFCWHDFFTCGGACPRTVKVLTKYQAEKKICWYHWEVVDACSCCGPQAAAPADSKCPIVFKAAPDDAQIGDAIELNDSDRAELAAYLHRRPKFRDRTEGSRRSAGHGLRQGARRRSTPSRKRLPLPPKRRPRQRSRQFGTRG